MISAEESFEDDGDINQQIENLTRVTEESIRILEEKKRQIREEADPLNGDTQLSANDLDAIIGEIDREISRIQAEHDIAVAELRQKQKFLDKQATSVDKLTLLLSVLTYQLFDTEYAYRKEVEEKMRQKEDLESAEVTDEDQRALDLAELDQVIADCKNTYESIIASLEGQRTELQREIVAKIENFELALEALKNQHDTIFADLETKKIIASPSFEEELNRRIDELHEMLESDIEKLRLQQAENMTDEERITMLLGERGLKPTKSGNILTQSGHRITRSAASCIGLFDGLNLPPWENVYPSPDDKIEIISPPETVSTMTEDTESTESEMSSDDTDYLKTALGVPLTLALAEITAKQPRDPIHYLGHWLFKYRYNQEMDQVKKREIQELIAERDRLEREKLHVMIEEEARAAVISMVIRAEEEAIRRELERIAREAAMYEDEEYESEARDVLGELQ